MNLIEAINSVGLDGFVYSRKGFNSTGFGAIENGSQTYHLPGRVAARFLIAIIGKIDLYSLLSDDWDVKESGGEK